MISLKELLEERRYADKTAVTKVQGIFLTHLSKACRVKCKGEYNMDPLYIWCPFQAGTQITKEEPAADSWVFHSYPKGMILSPFCLLCLPLCQFFQWIWVVGRIDSGECCHFVFWCQVSPAEKNTSETLCSLKFAERVRSVELGTSSRKAELCSWSSYEHLEVTGALVFCLCLGWLVLSGLLQASY